MQIIIFIFVTLLSVQGLSFATEIEHSKTMSPNGNVQIETSCPKFKECYTEVKQKNKKTVKLAAIGEPDVVWNEKNQAVLMFSCGNPCNYYHFFDERLGLSKAVNDPLVWSFEKNCVVVIGETAIDAKTIFGPSKTFRKKTYDSFLVKPYRAAAMVSVFDRKGSSLDAKGTLTAAYQNNQEQNTKVKIDNFCESKK